MDDYIERIIKQEKEELSRFLESAIKTINLVFSDGVVSIKRTPYKQYEDTLEIVHFSGDIAHINIAWNSNEATAKALFEYISTGKTQGFIDSTFSEDSE